MTAFNLDRRWAALAAPLLWLLAACSSTPALDDPKGSPEKLYAEAKEDLNSGSYDKAIKALERLEGRAAGTLLAQQAMLDLAYAQWKSGERVLAVATIDRFIKVNPSSPAMDYALYLKGLINFTDNLGIFSSFSRQDITERDQQASRDSYQAFQQLVDQYPKSKYSDEARARMDYIVNALATNEIHIARYYYRRGAYLAAASRAQHAVVEYPRAPATEEGLFIMSVCYGHLQLPQLRDDADRVLRANFPNSRYFKDGVLVTERAWWQFW